MQRFFDFVFAMLALLLFLPILCIVCGILKFTGEGEIFFRQTRIGKDQKEFKVFKFATMLKDSPNIGTGTVTIENDPRVLPFGKFLRKTKINELPQLLNILIGNMSFIGPRPQTKRCFEAFPKNTRKLITSVQPGLSGIGSIIFRNEEKILTDAKNSDEVYNDLIMPYKSALECWYVSNRSLRIYFSLIVLTIYAVFSHKTPNLWLIFKKLPQPPCELRHYFNG